MKLARHLGTPIAAASIALASLIVAPQASAATIYCQYMVVNAPNGLFIRSDPTATSHTLDKAPNGTTGLGSQNTTNGFRTFHGGWANAAYLSRTSGTLCGQ